MVVLGSNQQEIEGDERVEEGDETIGEGDERVEDLDERRKDTSLIMTTTQLQVRGKCLIYRHLDLLTNLPQAYY